jgi:hypothetical protein
MATAVTLVATLSWAAPPTPVKPGQKSELMRAIKDLNGIENPFVGRSSSAPVCETTSFEAMGACNFELGFVCGSAYAGFCPASGPTLASCTGNPAVDQDCCSNFPNALNGWWVLGANEFCGSPNILDVNPSDGEQHLRFSHDPLGGTTPACTGFAAIGCNPNILMGSVSVAQPTGNANFSYDLAMSASPAGALTGSLQFNTVGDAALGGGNAAVLFLYHSYYGLWFVYDYGTLGFGFAGYLTGDGLYNNLRAEFDICGEEVRYYVDNVLTYTGSTVGGGDRWNRGTWRYDNVPGNDWDLDHVITDRSGAGPCPQVCGNGAIEGTEECEPGVDEANCPGRCVAVGVIPGECTCSRPCADCGAPCAVGNGLSVPYLTDGGIYSYTADSPFTSVDTCDAATDYDTVIFWDLTPDCSGFGMVNDECNELDALLGQDAGDPSASCFVNTGGPPFQAEDFPLSSCLCAATTPGNSYTFAITEYGAGQPALGGTHVINIRKKTACGSPIVGGACCRGLTGVCEDGVSANECSGEFDTYTDGKLCSSPSVPACDAVTGSCCDSSPGAGGACSITTQADCNFTWTANGLCEDCAEVTGACCNALLGSCTVGIQSACNCPDCSWTQGALCSHIACNPIQGACCRQTEQTADCVQSSQAECSCENCTWTRETDCADVECDPLFTPIPTVSEWGLVIMALLLLVGGKVYFGRRQTAIA